MEVPTPSSGHRVWKDKEGHVHPDLRQRQSWTIKREIDPSFLLGALALLISAFVFVSKIQSRQDVQAVEIYALQQDKVAVKAEKLITEQQHREDIRAINEKLDRLLEEKHH